MRRAVLHRLSLHQHLRLCRYLHRFSSSSIGKNFWLDDECNCQEFNLHQDIFASSGFMLVAALFQIYLFCNCGQIVKNAAQDCSRAIYDSYWFQLTRVDQRKIVLLMLVQSQKDVGFIAGGFTVSLELFMNVSLKRNSKAINLSSTSFCFTFKWFLLKIILFKCVFCFYNCKFFCFFSFHFKCLSKNYYFISLHSIRKNASLSRKGSLVRKRKKLPQKV